MTSVPSRSIRSIRTCLLEKEAKQVAGETSSPRKSLKVTIIKKQPSTTPILPPSDNRERDEIAEATLLSLTLHKTALTAESQKNVAKFADLVFFNGEDDSSTRLEPGSHKENPKTFNDDDANEKDKKDDKKGDDNDDD
ncbi:hypothetical protein Tco_0057199, partial [Tanacetum coccineum]